MPIAFQVLLDDLIERFVHHSGTHDAGKFADHFIRVKLSNTGKCRIHKHDFILHVCDHYCFMNTVKYAGK